MHLWGHSMNVPYEVHGNFPNVGTLRSYLLGFVLVLILMGTGFSMVLGGVSRSVALAGVAVSALVQMAVHLVFFLRMNQSFDRRRNLLAYLFAVVIIIVLVTGSLGIMHHLHQNMMPLPMD